MTHCVYCVCVHACVWNVCVRVCGVYVCVCVCVCVCGVCMGGSTMTSSLCM